MRVTSCNGDAVTSRSPVLDPRKNETLDVVTSKHILCSINIFLKNHAYVRQSKKKCGKTGLATNENMAHGISKLDN